MTDHVNMPTSGVRLKGRCLCGAVTVEVERAEPVMRACHCEMCRQHTSSMFMSISTVPGSEEIEGPYQTYRSSEWAERGFCGACGSTLWYRTVEDGVRNFSAGLFPDAGGAIMKVEFFHDAKPNGYTLAGDHRKLTTEETIALFTGGET